MMYRRRYFFLLEVLICFSLWALLSPVLWFVSIQAYKIVLQEIKQYESQNLLRLASFALHSPGVLENMHFSWNDFDGNAQSKKARSLRELKLLQAGELKSWKDFTWNFRVYVLAYKVQQTPKKENEKYRAWRRLIRCEYDVEFNQDPPQKLVDGKLLFVPPHTVYEQFSLLKKPQS